MTHSADHPPAQAKLLAHPRFAPFFFTQLLTAFNDNFFKNALVIWIAHEQARLFGLGPEITITLCSGIFILPFFLLSATAGQLADRSDKTRVVRIVKIAEIAIMVCAAFGFMQGSLVLLLACVLAMGVHSAFLGPVKYGILPQLVTADELVAANALVETGTFLAILGGTIGGGLGILRADGALIVGGGAVVLAVLGWLASLRIPTLPAVAPELAVSFSPIKPTIEILRITARTRAVFLSVLGISWFWFFGAAFLTVLPIYVKQTLGAHEEVVTLLLSVFCIGIAAGSLSCEKISGKNLELGLVPLGSIGMTLLTLDLAWIGSPHLQLSAHGEPLGISAFLSGANTGSALHICIDLFMLAFFGGFFTVPLYTLIQQRAVPAERSRVVAGNNVLNALLMVLASAMLAGLFAAKVSVPVIFLVIAVLNASVAIYVYTLLPEFLLRFVAWILSRTLYRLTLRGHDHIPETGPAVFVCNHVSFLDWLVISGSIRRPLRFVMDHRIAATPVVSLIFKSGKTIPIAPEREDKAIMERAFERIAAELREGEVVCIFPEGKLTKDGQMSPFKAGIERIIAQTPVPVVPMALDGLWGSMFSRQGGPAMQKLPKRFRAKVRLTIGEPVAPQNVSAADLQQRVSALLAS